LSNILGGDPLTINPDNGFMTGIPNTLGNFVVGVCVDEYRDGTVISTTRRDFQYNVADCGTPTAAFLVPEQGCENQVIKFENQSIALFYKWYFDWENNPDLTSTDYSPTFLYPDTGTYTVALITVPGEPCADTMFQEIHIGGLYIDADMEYELPTCDNNGLVINATDLSMDSVYGIASWQWRLSGPSGFTANSSNQNHTFVVTKPGSYKLRLIAISEGGCRDTIERQFNAPIPRTDSLRAALTICAGDTIRLNSGAIPNYFYQWAPPETLSDTAVADPLAFPLGTTEYFVTITNAFCTYEGKVTVTVIDTAGLMVSADPTTIYQGQTSQLEAVFPGNNSINWMPPNTLSNAKIPNPVASPTQTTTYTASFSTNSGCTVERDVTIVVLSPFCADEFVFLPTGFSPNGDGENDVLQLESRFAEEVYWAVYNRWGQKVFETDRIEDGWDGTFKGEPQPTETYGFYLRAVCPGGTELVRKGNVTLLR
jgi:gliding motility-associated-like protein